MTGLQRLVYLGLFLLLAGCGGSSSDGGSAGDACQSVDDCGGDLVCYQSVCTDPADVPQDSDDLSRSLLISEENIDTSADLLFPFEATKSGETVVYFLENVSGNSTLKAYFPDDGSLEELSTSGFESAVGQVVAGDKEIAWKTDTKNLSRYGWLDRTLESYESERQTVPGICIRKKPGTAGQTREVMVLTDNSKIHLLDTNGFDQVESVDLDDPESDDKRDLGPLAFACDVEEGIAVIFGRDGRVYSMDLSTDDFVPQVLDSELNIVDGGLAEIDQLQVVYPWAVWMDRRGDIWGIDLENGTEAIKLAVPDPQTVGIVRVEDMRLSKEIAGQGPFVTWTSNLGGGIDVYVQDLATRTSETDYRKIHLVGVEKWPAVISSTSGPELIWCGRKDDTDVYRIYRALLGNP